MEVFVVSLLNGLVYGMLLFMLASGLTLILSMMCVLNFAHASAYMLGAYFAYTISTYVGFWPALVIAPVACGLLGAAIEMWGLRQVHRNGHIAELLFTFGLALIIEKLVQMTWGLIPVPYRIPTGLDFPLFTIYGTQFPAYRAFMLLISALMFAAIWLGLTRTRIGLIIQAALTHPDMVGALGHNVPPCSPPAPRSRAWPASSAATTASPTPAWPSRWAPSSSSSWSSAASARSPAASSPPS